MFSPTVRGVAAPAVRGVRTDPLSDRDWETYVARTGSLAAPTQRAVADFIAGLKSDLGIDTLARRIDFMYLFAHESSAASLINMAQNAYDATVPVSPTFAQFQGWTGNASSQYVETGFNPSTANGAMTLNAHHLSAYIRNSRSDTTNQMTIAARQVTPTADVTIAARFTGATIMRGGDAQSAVTSPGSPNSTAGWWCIVRPDASNTRRFRNAVNFSNTSVASVALPNTTFNVLRRNINGATPDGYSSDQVAFVSGGDKLTDAEAVAFFYRIEALLDGLNAGVV